MDPCAHWPTRIDYYGIVRACLKKQSACCWRGDTGRSLASMHMCIHRDMHTQSSVLALLLGNSRYAMLRARMLLWEIKGLLCLRYQHHKEEM